MTNADEHHSNNEDDKTIGKENENEGSDDE